MPPDLSKIELAPREPLAAEIARKLIDHLVRSGEVNPGDRLPSERDLAEALGVGRSVVREALKALSFIGLIEVRQGDGTYLKRADSALLPRVIEWGLLLGERRVVDLVEARHPIEVTIARLAAERRDERTLAELRAVLDTMHRSTADPEGWVDADLAFHAILARAADNAVLADVASSILSLLRVWFSRVLTSGSDREPAYREHLAIFEAIERGDPVAAAAATEALMAAVKVRVWEVLKVDESAVRHHPATAGRARR